MAAAKKNGVNVGEKPSDTTSQASCDVRQRDSVVMVIPENDGNFKVKVGFLKTHHYYEITFTLPEVPGLGEDVCPAPIPSPHLRIIDITPAPKGGLKITCQYMAQEEGVLCEEMQLVSKTKSDVCVRVKIHARVMDRHYGTATLLEGVRCIAVALEYVCQEPTYEIVPL
ncbi:adipose-secreted signaling protein-like [Synchiropus picturatus]